MTVQPLARFNILKEIYETETIYNKNLNIIIEAYATPLKQMIEKADHDVIFSQLNVIIMTNSTLMQQLSVRLQEESEKKKLTLEIGEIFLKFAPFLKSYVSYCNNHEKVRSKIQELSTKNKKFKEFCTQQRKLSVSGGYDIDSLLIMPVQRIPRYNLLLKDLLSKTSRQHRDYDNLKKALEKIQETADHVNKGMKQFENQQKIHEIGESLDMKLVIPSRWYKSEGNLNLYTNGVFEERFTYLFNDSILFTSKKDAKALKFIEFEKVPFPWILDIKDQTGFTNSFHFVTDKETVILSFESLEKKNLWIQEIESVLNSLIDRNKDYKTNRADLSPQTIIEKRKLSLFGTDKPAYPTQRKEVVSLEEAKKVVKPIGMCRAVISHPTKLLDDELVVLEGDIMEILVKGVKNSSTDWLIVKKLGLNCNPCIGTVKYSEFIEMFSKEKKKKIVGVNLISLIESPPLLIPKKIDKYDDSFFSSLHNLIEEKDEIGIVPVKSIVVIDESTASKIIDAKFERDKKEEKKVRNFSVLSSPKK